VELLAGGGGGSGEGSRSVISWPEEAMESVAASAAPDGVREILELCGSSSIYFFRCHTVQT
jgi:hypothetical protein